MYLHCLLKVFSAKIVNDNKRSNNAYIWNVFTELEQCCVCVVECRFLWLCWRREIKELNGREYLCYWGDFMRAAILTVISPRLTAWSWYSKCHLFIQNASPETHLYHLWSDVNWVVLCVCRSCRHCCLWRPCHLSQRSVKRHKSRFRPIHIRLICLEELMWVSC